MMKGYRVSQCLDYFVIVAFVFHDNRIKVVGVFEVAHGAERHVDVLVQVVITVVDDMFQDADDLVGDAVHTNALADRILTGKKLLLGVGSDKSHARVSEVLSFAEGSTFGKFHTAHTGIIGVDATYPIAGAACPPGHAALLEHFGREPFEQRHLVTDVVQIFDRETDFAARLGTTRLMRGATGKEEDQIGAEGAERRPQTALESRSVRQKQHHRGDAPGHAEHGEDAASLVMAQGAIGLGSKFVEDGYSCLL